MAEFCDECRVKMGAPPGPKSDEGITKELAKEHGSWSLLCEGCSNWIVYDSEGKRTVEPIYPSEEGVMATSGLMGLTDEQKEELASILETDIRASLSVGFKQVGASKQGINVGTLFEIIGIALAKFARAIDAKGKER